eukprot:TRINITY_DN32245_c0_g1_i1.p1 TRINITY_DN32245_c0_g1~~TRINITY_DN32245_c0_g1_i1.p1  ORF type:complete len:120 (-),score=12.51 TRINITY_DN32245_c0_g1_i1:67-426(-)
MLSCLDLCLSSASSQGLDGTPLRHSGHQCRRLGLATLCASMLDSWLHALLIQEMPAWTSSYQVSFWLVFAFWLQAIVQALQFLSLIHISEPTRLLSISYAVFCLKKKNKKFINENILKK